MKKAIAYYRHSAEDKQENSVPIQREHAKKFAAQYQLEIIHEEADEGKTGLLASRPGFERLFNDWILNPDAPHFDYVLVYDVSRWGRFQDQDEAAYYEFRCKQRDKKVIYIVRGFPKEEQQLISHLQTSIERYMAAEYSRQLSDKVFYGCVKVSEQGYSAGGTSCYGMTRVLLDANKKPIKPLKRGEWKSLSNERVTFAPANDETTEAVKEMFTLLVKKWRSPKEIAEIMNERRVPSANGGLWNSQKVIHVLTNETYTGARIYNTTWGRLRQKMRQNPRNEWVIKPDAFAAVVESDVFREAQEHLYWLLNSKWKRGIYAISRVRKMISHDLRDILLKRGIPHDEIEETIRKIPIVFGVRFYHNSTPHWCFLIEETARNHDFIVGVSVAIDQREPVDRFFFIPTNDFNVVNFNVFSEADECYGKYKVEENKIEEKILSFLTA
jgi:DNA invertase Pin-like site-specific DNA recombinase